MLKQKLARDGELERFSDPDFVPRANFVYLGKKRRVA